MTTETIAAFGKVLVTVLSLPIFATIVAAWQKREFNNNTTVALLTSIAHYQILTECKSYIASGYISHTDYEAVYTLLFEPYLSAGGNGYVSKLISAVGELPNEPRDPGLYESA